jgi:hypothetical protein
MGFTHRLTRSGGQPGAPRVVRVHLSSLARAPPQERPAKTMSVYEPMQPYRPGAPPPTGRLASMGRGGPGGRRDSGLSAATSDGLTDEQRALLEVLTGSGDNDKLYQIMCNYLALSQFELARSVLDQLFTLSPERVVRVLRTLVLSPRPQKWCEPHCNAAAHAGRVQPHAVGRWCPRMACVIH